MNKHFLAAVFLSCLLGISSWARADVIPPEASACIGKQSGDSCSTPKDGTCQNDTCARIDYANWNRDASSSPPSMKYPCVLCAPKGSSGSDPDASSAPSDASSPASDASSPAPDASPHAPDASSSSSDASTSSSDASSSSSDAGKAKKDDGGGCALGSSDSAQRRWLALGMAALFGALLLRRKQAR